MARDGLCPGLLVLTSKINQWLLSWHISDCVRNAKHRHIGFIFGLVVQVPDSYVIKTTDGPNRKAPLLEVFQ